jgi:hypothetical protein
MLSHRLLFLARGYLILPSTLLNQPAHGTKDVFPIKISPFDQKCEQALDVSAYSQIRMRKRTHGFRNEGMSRTPSRISETCLVNLRPQVMKASSFAISFVSNVILHLS